MKGGVQCCIRTNLKRSWKEGASVLVAGICSTIIKKRGSELTFFFMDETLSRTTVAGWGVGESVNIEPSLRYGEELSGHILSGHVDGVGKVLHIGSNGKMRALTVAAPRAFLRYAVPKGSVALDGVSLTVVSVSDTALTVAFIPYTLSHTTFGKIRVGSDVNIETDVAAKYIEKLCNKNKKI